MHSGTLHALARYSQGEATPTSGDALVYQDVTKVVLLGKQRWTRSHDAKQGHWHEFLRGVLDLSHDR
jgi:hypothetical protein